MTNMDKLEHLKKSLTENGFSYTIPKHHGMPGHSDLVIDNFWIVVKVNKDGEGDDPTYYERHKRHFYIIVIRDVDTMEYVVTKAQNAIIKSIMRQQRCEENKERKAKYRQMLLEKQKRNEARRNHQNYGDGRKKSR
jgi:hypothetical protein